MHFKALYNRGTLRFELNDFRNTCTPFEIVVQKALLAVATVAIEVTALEEKKKLFCNNQVCDLLVHFGFQAALSLIWVSIEKFLIEKIILKISQVSRLLMTIFIRESISHPNFDDWKKNSFTNLQHTLIPKPRLHPGPCLIFKYNDFNYWYNDLIFYLRFYSREYEKATF
ncbi:hypothetical protein BpHYR1_037024 [Brachionus plicatilis]|uniref:Uncharacterized protein n=1 Tax=Brachionus plicatilis TaxID=10195 RepID=A0A3M7SN16_BRAPC|nr:hypothetical protein BpHYR1_037024 [Brachionus plicatilis]